MHKEAQRYFAVRLNDVRLGCGMIQFRKTTDELEKEPFVSYATTALDLYLDIRRYGLKDMGSEPTEFVEGGGLAPEDIISSVQSLDTHYQPEIVELVVIDQKVHVELIDRALHALTGIKYLIGKARLCDVPGLQNKADGLKKYLDAFILRFLDRTPDESTVLVLNNKINVVVNSVENYAGEYSGPYYTF